MLCLDPLGGPCSLCRSLACLSSMLQIDGHSSFTAALPEEKFAVLDGLAQRPGHHLVEDLVSDLRDRFPADFNADRGDKVMLDITHRRPACIERYDHVIEPAQTP